MLFKLALIAFVALATLAFTAAIDKPDLSLYTDDVDMLSRTNISHLLHFLDSPESRSMSADGTGLKLAALRFHPDSHNKSQNPSDTRLGTRNAATCDTPNCAPETTSQFTGTTQPRNMIAPICNYIVVHAQGGVAMVRFFLNSIAPKNANVFQTGVQVFYNNALLLNEVAGTISATLAVYEPTHSLENNAALLGQCQLSMIDVANSCGLYGGSAECHGPGNDGLWVYYIQPKEMLKPLQCGQMTMFAGSWDCHQVNCWTMEGKCFGAPSA